MTTMTSVKLLSLALAALMLGACGKPETATPAVSPVSQAPYVDPSLPVATQAPPAESPTAVRENAPPMEVMTKKQESVAMPLPGQVNDHSSPAAEKKN